MIVRQSSRPGQGAQTVIRKIVRDDFVQNAHGVILFAHDVTHFQYYITIEQNFMNPIYDVKS